MKKTKTKKSPGVVPNKTLEIRKIAGELVSQGKPPRPSEIVARMKEKGISVVSAHVSTALRDTEFAFRKNRKDWERPLPEPNLNEVSLDDLNAASQFARTVGGNEKALAAIMALRLLKQEQEDPEETEDFYGGA